MDMDTIQTTFVETCRLLLRLQTHRIHIESSLHIGMAIPTSGKYISFRKGPFSEIKMHSLYDIYKLTWIKLFDENLSH